MRQRHPNESAISALSVALVAMTAVALVLFARDPALIYTPHVRSGAPSGAAVASQPGTQATQDPQDPRMAEIGMRFQQAVVMLHARRYDDAVTALHRVLELSPRLPEAHVNMGYALLGLGRHQAARDFFRTAIDLQPYQGNAYWGLAVALENLGDLRGALGAMRTYIHLAPPGDPFVRKARAALWEWDTRLARGPLPEHEAEWIERRTREWVERNSPERDAPERGGTEIRVRDIK